MKTIFGFIAITNLLLASPVWAQQDPNREFLSGWSCSATTSTASRGDTDPKALNARFVFRLVKISGEVQLEKLLGHVDDVGYYGIFSFEKVAPTPYVRPPQVYKEHYRFMKIDALETGGSESGMWGSLYVPMKMASEDADEKAEISYMYQAGDHRGGTIRFSCERTI